MGIRTVVAKTRLRVEKARAASAVRENKRLRAETERLLAARRQQTAGETLQIVIDAVESQARTIRSLQDNVVSLVALYDSLKARLDEHINGN